MKRTVILTTLVSVTVLGSALALASRVISMRTSGNLMDARAPSTTSKTTPILVELFTSEGCSSCPPADALLARLAKSSGVDGAQIIPLEEHVDYWNHLGWADPYSGARYSARQKSYAQLMHLDQVYTPQMVVDGRKELLGSDESAARSAVSESLLPAKAAAEITASEISDTDVSLNVHIDPIPESRDATDIVVVVTEDNLQSNVSRGENAGRRLSHVGVVRTWQVIGHGNKNEAFTASPRVTLESSWKKTDLHAVLFVQGHDSGQVYAAATAKIVVGSLKPLH
jgi:hypothetical protein